MSAGNYNRAAMKRAQPRYKSSMGGSRILRRRVPLRLGPRQRSRPITGNERVAATGRYGWSDGGARRRPMPPRRVYKSGKVL